MVWTGDASNRLAKSLLTLFNQVEQSFPNRKRKGNDGTIGDAAHQAEGDKSDHNPHVHVGATGVVTALDITHDPVNGFDAGAFAESLRQEKDPRISYVIFNGRIFNSKVSPWEWRARNRGPGDHSEHVHISVLADPTLFDDPKPWKFDKSQSVAPPGGYNPRPKLRVGDSGPAVVDLQNLLGIAATGEFSPVTELAVRAFQTSRNIRIDGIVGSETWGALTQTPLKPTGEVVDVKLPEKAIADIVKLAGDSELLHVNWNNRGLAPAGYIKGMAVAFGYAYAKFKAGSAMGQVLAAADGGHDDSDALAWYHSIFRAAGMDNSTSGAATLRHLFVLMIGLGMRESSGQYFVGRDTSAHNTDADTAEAGLFQMSWNMRSASPEMARLFAAYSAGGESFLSIFKEGVSDPKPSDLENFGIGEGVAYQKLAKSCPAFAVETAALGLRMRRQHWGPINDQEAEIRSEADALLTKVQGVIDTPGLVTAISRSDSADAIIPLLIAFLDALSKGKTMADTPATPATSTDAVKTLLPILLPLLTSLVTGKPIDSSQTTTTSGQTSDTLPTQSSAQVDQIDKLLAAIAALILPKVDPKATMPVTNALGATIGSLLDGKKTAIGMIGTLVTSLLSVATTAAPTAPGALPELSALGKVLEAFIPAAGLSGYALPIFLVTTGWGVLSKLEKWTQQIAQSQK